MESARLRELQAPLKARYREDAGAALVTLRAEGSLDGEGIACKVETGRALVEAGLHPATGGSGLEACSGDMLLEALVACAGVTLKAVATALEFRLKGGTVKAEGDLDFRGTLGVERSAPVGFRAIRLAFALDTDEPQDRIDSLLKLTERYASYCRPCATRRRSRPACRAGPADQPGGRMPAGGEIRLPEPTAMADDHRMKGDPPGGRP